MFALVAALVLLIVASWLRQNATPTTEPTPDGIAIASSASFQVTFGSITTPLLRMGRHRRPRDGLIRGGRHRSTPA
jgi:hypothetical protein